MHLLGNVHATSAHGPSYSLCACVSGSSFVHFSEGASVEHQHMRDRSRTRALMRTGTQPWVLGLMSVCCVRVCVWVWVCGGWVCGCVARVHDNALHTHMNHFVFIRFIDDCPA